jgi:hypothetical protein
MVYVYAIIFMLVTSPILLVTLGLIAQWAARRGMSASLGTARAYAFAMYAAQVAVPLIALYFLWARVIVFGYEEHDGHTYINFLPEIICLPYSLWFAKYSLGGVLGILGLPFGDPRPRFALVQT